MMVVKGEDQDEGYQDIRESGICAHRRLFIFLWLLCLFLANELFEKTKPIWNGYKPGKLCYTPAGPVIICKGGSRTALTEPAVLRRLSRSGPAAYSVCLASR
jgi:hypothetical protein